VKQKPSAWRWARTLRWSLSFWLGALALTACATAKSRPPMPTLVSIEIPSEISAACARSDKPSLPPSGSLDMTKPKPGSDGQFSAADFKTLWDRFEARGLWILALSSFSIAQEGDVSACDARRAAAVDIVRAASAPPTN